MVPSTVLTGCVKGCKETAQKLNGRRLKLDPTTGDLWFLTPEPALAEKASSEAHSECVIWCYEYAPVMLHPDHSHTAYQCLQLIISSRHRSRLLYFTFPHVECSKVGLNESRGIVVLRVCRISSSTAVNHTW